MRYRLFCGVTAILLSLTSFAGGWEDIKKGDFRSAQLSFQKALESDSTDRSALEGMIFLSEVRECSHDYQKYITTYVRTYWDEEFFLLFQSAFKGEDKEVIKNDKLTERAKLRSKIDFASDEGDKTKDYKKKYNAYRELIGKYYWAMIGPFKNEAGSGYAETYPIENAVFDTTKVYADESGRDMKWIIPSSSAGTGRIFFNHHLNSSSYKDGTYFANAFIDVPSDRKVYLRLDRSSPIKLWLDDDLIYESKEKINANYDNEVIALDIKKGVHRIFIKNATHYGSHSRFKMLNFWDNMVTYSTRVTVRITDENGKLMKDITSKRHAAYVKHDYNPIVTRYPILVRYQKMVDDDPSNLFGYYALCKAYVKTGFYREAEKRFIKYYRANPNSAFFTYLMAKIYSANGKSEKVYPMLNALDLDQTMIFEILYSKHKELDKKNEEEKYLASLDKLLKINPPHYSLNSSYVSYYDKKGEDEKKDAFINDLIKRYPHLKSSFEKKLSTYKKGKSKYSAEAKLERQKEALKRVKSEYSETDFKTAIKYYKEKDKSSKVLKLYDELIAGMPHIDDYYYDKSKFLFEKDRFDEAEFEVKRALKINAFNPTNRKLLGDIYRKQEKDEEAIREYKNALAYNTKSYTSSSIQKEIEKIEGNNPLKKIFKTRTFEEALADDGWKKYARGEESVVLMYTKDMVWNEYDMVEVYQRMLVKILTKGGADRWTQYNFKFMGTLQSVKVVKRNGQEVVPDSRSGYVVFKDLAPGDVIKLEGKTRYRLSSKFDKQLDHRHYISFGAPIYYHKLEIAMPKDRQLTHVCHKVEDNLRIDKREKFNHYVWQHENVEPLKKEEAVLDNTDRYANIMISTMKDWSGVVKWYERKTYRRLEPTYDIKEILDTIIQPNMSDSQKVVSVYNHITEDIKYSHVSFLNSAYTPKYPTNTCSGKIGDCKDVSTLMITMLRQLGIEAYYVLVKTSHYHHLAMVPSLQFDHVIVGYKLNGREYFADLTTNFYPHYVLTEIDVNAWALRIKSGEKDVFRLPNDFISEKKNKIRVEVVAQVNADRSIDMEVETSHIGMAGGKIREKLYTTPPYKQKTYALELLGKGVFENLQIQSLDFGNKDEILAPLKSSFKLRSEGFSDKVANLFILRIPYMKAVLPNAALLTEKRLNRLDVNDLLDAQPIQHRVVMKFPVGYKLTELPEDVSEKSEFGEYSIRFKKIPNGIEVYKSQIFYRNVIDIKDFDAFKKYYLKILDHDKMKIAIQRKARA